jgi:hypothetical protein
MFTSLKPVEVFSSGRATYHWQSVVFHKFPDDEKLRMEWIVAIRRDEGINLEVCLVLVDD